MGRAARPRLHLDRRLQPLPGPRADRCPARVRRLHPHAGDRPAEAGQRTPWSASRSPESRSRDPMGYRTHQCL